MIFAVGLVDVPFQNYFSLAGARDEEGVAFMEKAFGNSVVQVVLIAMSNETLDAVVPWPSEISSLHCNQEAFDLLLILNLETAFGKSRNKLCWEFC